MNRIRELRKQKKMTQKELAKHLRIADSTLSYWEMGKYEPDNESLRKLSKFFLVSIDYILGGDMAEWELARNRVIYTDVDKQLPSGGAMSIGEGGTTYETNQHETNHKNDDSVMFDRKEFAGLTGDEMDKLALYAEFLKSLREKKDAGGFIKSTNDNPE